MPEIQEHATPVAKLVIWLAIVLMPHWTVKDTEIRAVVAAADPAASIAVVRVTSLASALGPAPAAEAEVEMSANVTLAARLDTFHVNARRVKPMARNVTPATALVIFHVIAPSKATPITALGRTTELAA